MPRPNEDNSDALSMRTLDSSTFSPTDGYFTNRDHPTAVYANAGIARKEIPVRNPSPSHSSTFSSPPTSPIQWTPDNASEFSDESSALLGSRTPPPGYMSTAPSIRDHYYATEPRQWDFRSYGSGLRSHVPPSEGHMQNMGDEEGSDGQGPSESHVRRQQFRRILRKIAHFVVIVCIVGALYKALRTWKEVRLSYSVTPWYTLLTQSSDVYPNT